MHYVVVQARSLSSRRTASSLRSAPPPPQPARTPAPLPARVRRRSASSCPLTATHWVHMTSRHFILSEKQVLHVWLGSNFVGFNRIKCHDNSTGFYARTNELYYGHTSRRQTQCHVPACLHGRAGPCGTLSGPGVRSACQPTAARRRSPLGSKEKQKVFL